MVSDLSLAWSLQSLNASYSAVPCFGTMGRNAPSSEEESSSPESSPCSRKRPRSVCEDTSSIHRSRRQRTENVSHGSQFSIPPCVASPPNYPVSRGPTAYSPGQQDIPVEGREATNSAGPLLPADSHQASRMRCVTMHKTSRLNGRKIWSSLRRAQSSQHQPSRTTGASDLSMVLS